MEPARGPAAPAEEKDPWEDSPLLMSKLPDDWSTNEQLAGLQALMYDEQTPDERAAVLKEQGNEILKHPQLWARREALECYTRGLTDAQDPALRLALYLNRAHAHLMFGNFGHAWEDSISAVAIDPKSVKAHFRAAKAAYSMKKPDPARTHISSVLLLDPENKDAKALLVSVEALEKKQRDDEERKQREDAERVNMRKDLLLQLRMLGFRLGAPLYDKPQSINDEAKIDVTTGEVSWPVLFLYPQYSQSDFIASFNDSHPFAAHLDEMFPPVGAAAPWDAHKEYLSHKIEIYFLANAVPEVKAGAVKGAKRWVKVASHVALRKALMHKEHVIPGFPVFHLLVPGAFRDKFLSDTDY